MPRASQLSSITEFFIPWALLMSIWTTVLALLLWPLFSRIKQIVPRAPLFMAANFCSAVFVFAAISGVTGLNRDGEMQGAFFGGLFVGAGTLWPLLLLGLLTSLLADGFVRRKGMAIVCSVIAVVILVGGGVLYVASELL
ncbi:hypothetical protein G7068_11475 [Leucobacter viscericola]|uniref:Uncharacterized protein n=1 Tax=Leucobacter viscericola TaxID=2714935 RepID=A0A6G7XH17_9MICO|nr:hypothetical protein [Leucobacter viscericola]QIK63739.1 hypothetical protein G7068_11475 [Leucobacter viscericola]